MANRHFLKNKMNNSGAALVTVIVVIAFISVVATILLYMSGVNFYMKATDKEVKDSFYEAETAMENVQMALMVEAQKAYQAACEETMMYFDQESEDARKNRYNSKFVASLQEQFNVIVADNGGDPVGLQNYLRLKSGYGDKLTTASTNVVLEDGIITIKDVSITYIKDNYVTMITTDFQIKPPAVDWGIDASQSSWDSSYDASEVLSRERISMANSVIYSNWRKE